MKFSSFFMPYSFNSFRGWIIEEEKLSGKKYEKWLIESFNFCLFEQQQQNTTSLFEQKQQ